MSVDEFVSIQGVVVHIAEAGVANVEYLRHSFGRRPMGWCNTALLIVVLLLEGLEVKFITDGLCKVSFIGGLGLDHARPG